MNGPIGSPFLCSLGQGEAFIQPILRSNRALRVVCRQWGSSREMDHADFRMAGKNGQNQLGYTTAITAHVRSHSQHADQDTGTAFQ